MLRISPVKDRKTIRIEAIEDSLDKEHKCYHRRHTIQLNKDKTKENKLKICDIETRQVTDKRQFELCINAILI